MAVGLPGQRLPIPEAELKVKGTLSQNCLCYPSLMGSGKQIFWLFLCVGVKFTFPALALWPPSRLHSKVQERDVRECNGRDVVSAT